MKLAAKLPKDHAANGVEHGEAAFLARPLEQVVVVAYLGTEKITTDYDKGGREATVQVQAIEIIEDDDALRAVRAAFEHAHDARVNRAPTLPDAPDQPQRVQPSREDVAARSAVKALEDLMATAEHRGHRDSVPMILIEECWHALSDLADRIEREARS